MKRNYLENYSTKQEEHIINKEDYILYLTLDLWVALRSIESRWFVCFCSLTIQQQRKLLIVWLGFLCIHRWSCVDTHLCCFPITQNLSKLETDLCCHCAVGRSKFSSTVSTTVLCIQQCLPFMSPAVAVAGTGRLLLGGNRRRLGRHCPQIILYINVINYKGFEDPRQY